MFLFQYHRKYYILIGILVILFSSLLYSCSLSVFVEKPKGSWSTEDKNLILDFNNESGMINSDGEFLDISVQFHPKMYSIRLVYRGEIEDIDIFVGYYKLSPDKQKLELIKDDKVVYTLKRIE